MNATPSRLDRRGLATLEFVLCIPVLAILFVSMVWIGNFLMGHAEMTIGARNDAFERRYDPQGNAFKFDELSEIAGQKSTTVKLDSAIHPTKEVSKSHTVLAGAWDFREVDLNTHPDWEHFGQLGVEGKLGPLKEKLRDVENLLGDIPNMMADALKQFAGPLGSIIDAGKNAADQGKKVKEENDRKREAEAKNIRENDIPASEARIKTLEGELQKMNDRVAAIDKILKDDEKAPEDKKLKEDEKKKLEDERKDLKEKKIPDKRKEIEKEKKRLQMLKDQLAELNKEN